MPERERERDGGNMELIDEVGYLRIENGKRIKYWQ